MPNLCICKQAPITSIYHILPQLQEGANYLVFVYINSLHNMVDITIGYYVNKIL